MIIYFQTIGKYCALYDSVSTILRFKANI